MGAPGRWCFHRQVAARGKTRDFEQHRKDEDGQRHHEHRNLGVGLGRQVCGCRRRDAGHEGRRRSAGHQGCGDDGDALETIPLGRRRFVHGIDVKPCRCDEQT